MPFILAALTWIGVMILGLAIVFGLIFLLSTAGLPAGVLPVISFILGLPIGVVAMLVAMDVYDRTV